MNRCWQQLSSFGWILLMVQGRDHSVVAKQSPVTNIDSALVLDGAASIDKKLSSGHQLCFFTSMST